MKMPNYFLLKKTDDSFYKENLKIVYCNCPEKIPVVKNYLSSKASHFKNPGKEYFYCSRYALKSVGVKLKQLNRP